MRSQEAALGAINNYRHRHSSSSLESHSLSFPRAILSLNFSIRDVSCTHLHWWILFSGLETRAMCEVRMQVTLILRSIAYPARVAFQGAKDVY